MANVKICDRCGELMRGSYYEIDITAHDVQNTALSTNETLSYNLVRSMSMTFTGPKTYCRKCVNEIEKFINKC